MFCQCNIWPTQLLANTIFGGCNIWPMQHWANTTLDQPIVLPTQHLSNTILGRPNVWPVQYSVGTTMTHHWTTSLSKSCVSVDEMLFGQVVFVQKTRTNLKVDGYLWMSLYFSNKTWLRNGLAWPSGKFLAIMSLETFYTDRRPKL
jgi:hypothetical protein